MDHEWRKGAYLISTDAARLDREFIYQYLTSSYWSPDIPKELVERAIAHSLNFGLYHERAQIGFARVITDRATFAYVCDVFVLDRYQRQGLGTWLMEAVSSHPDLQGLRRWILLTRDAHALYRKMGFTPIVQPERFMERAVPDVYRARKAP